MQLDLMNFLLNSQNTSIYSILYFKIEGSNNNIVIKWFHVILFILLPNKIIYISFIFIHFHHFHSFILKHLIKVTKFHSIPFPCLNTFHFFPFPYDHSIQFHFIPLWTLKQSLNAQYQQPAAIPKTSRYP